MLLQGYRIWFHMICLIAHLVSTVINSTCLVVFILGVFFFDVFFGQNYLIIIDSFIVYCLLGPRPLYVMVPGDMLVC